MADEVRLVISRTEAGKVRVCAPDPDGEGYDVAAEGNELADAFFNFCGAVGTELINKDGAAPVAVELALISKGD